MISSNYKYIFEEEVPHEKELFFSMPLFNYIGDNLVTGENIPVHSKIGDIFIPNFSTLFQYAVKAYYIHKREVPNQQHEYTAIKLKVPHEVKRGVAVLMNNQPLSVHDILGPGFTIVDKKNTGELLTHVVDPEVFYLYIENIDSIDDTRVCFRISYVDKKLKMAGVNNQWVTGVTSVFKLKDLIKLA